MCLPSLVSFTWSMSLSGVRTSPHTPSREFTLSGKAAISGEPLSTITHGSVLGAVRQSPHTHGTAQGTRGWRAERPSAARGSRQSDGQMRHPGENEHRGRWGVCGGVASVRDRGGGQADSRLEKQQSHGTAGGRNKMCGWHSGEWRANFEGFFVVVVVLAKGLRDGWIWPWHGGPA